MIDSAGSIWCLLSSLVTYRTFICRVIRPSTHSGTSIAILWFSLMSVVATYDPSRLTLLIPRRAADSVVKLSNCGSLANHDHIWLWPLHRSTGARIDCCRVFLSWLLLQSGLSTCFQAAAGGSLENKYKVTLWGRQWCDIACGNGHMHAAERTQTLTEMTVAPVHPIQQFFRGVYQWDDWMFVLVGLTVLVVVLPSLSGFAILKLPYWAPA
jgi:hypothetical protein